MGVVTQATPPILRSSLFHTGQRVAVAVSGGADSVALVRRLLEERIRLGIELSVVHVHHGIRGVAADDDVAFVESLATGHGLPFHLHRADAPAAAQAFGETLEEAARNVRYGFFRQWMLSGQADAIATGHTLDDQAETVLGKLLRGAWTEGLSGIHPVLAEDSGAILRPFLDNRHAALEEWLRWLPQPWREDSSNQDMAYTRNRIRSQLVPLLRTFNPQIAVQLSRLASISADEETYWQGEMSRLLPGLLLPGRPTRGAGRSTSTHPEEQTVAMEQSRLRELPPAVGRRVVRAAARLLGARLSFDHTEQVLALLTPAAGGSRPGKFDIPGQIRVERSLREIRFTRMAAVTADIGEITYPFRVPGEVTAPAFGMSLQGECEDGEKAAVLRSWRPGDRVKLRHSRSPKKVADVLDRLHIVGEPRKRWPVVEAERTIVWMRGVEVEGEGMTFAVQLLPDGEGHK